MDSKIELAKTIQAISSDANHLRWFFHLQERMQVVHLKMYFEILNAIQLYKLNYFLRLRGNSFFWIWNCQFIVHALF